MTKIPHQLLLELLEFTDLTLYSKIQKKRKRYYIDTIKCLYNKYGVDFYNLIEKGARLGLSISSIKKYADQILNGEYKKDHKKQSISIGRLEWN